MPRISARSLLSLAALLVAVAALPAQTGRPLTHDDYDQWKSLRGTTYSLDGSWVAYQIEPQVGDGVLEIHQSTGDRVFRQPLASGAHFTTDGRFVVFTIGKSKVEERNKKIDDLRKKAKEQKEGKKPEAETKAEGGGAAEPTPEAGRRGPGGAFPGAGAFAGRGGAGAGGAGRRGPGGAAGGAPGAEGGDAASRERSELAVLDLATGEVKKLGKVKGHTLSDDVAVMLYQPEKIEPKPDAAKDGAKPGETGAGAEAKGGEAKGGEAKGGEAKAGEAKAGEAKGGEVKPPEPRPPEAGAAEPKAGEAKAAEPPAGEVRGEGAAEGERGGRRGGGRRGFGGAAGPGGQGARPGADASTDPLEKKRPEGSELVIHDFTTGEDRRIQDVVSYGLSRKSRWLWYQTSAKKPAKDGKYGLFVVPLAGGEPIQLLDGCVHVGNVTWTRDEDAVAFTSDKEDFAAEKPTNDVYFWSGGSAPARRIVHAGTAGMPAGKRLSGGLSFSRDGSVLELGVASPPEPEPLPILPEDKVALDLWNWRDGQLQTQQQKGGMDRNATWTAVWHRDQDRLVVLGDDRLRSLRFVGPDGSRLLGTDGKDYDKETSWDGRYQDVWLVNSLDGSRTKVLEKLRGNVSNSPGGRYLVWFGPDAHWWCYDVATGGRRDLTGHLPVAFHQEDDDHPEPDAAHGIAGFTENDRAVLFYDKFDVWKVDLGTGEAACVTDGFGRASHIVLRIQSLPRADESEYVPTRLVLNAVNDDTKAEGLFTDALDTAQKPQRIWMVDKNVADVTRPKLSTRWFFTQSTFSEFPDLWTANADFTALRRLSEANPQQKEYRWGKEELVHWVDADGHDCQGILIKPDGFDPAKKYPMLVYFYERMTQGLHNYVPPAAGTSPNASYYVSNGYLWFMPDVRYEVGYPGMSCVKSVVSGVQSLIAQGFVDPHGVGASGHSWGGYQTAFLVTRTNIFAAVESGAPVANMISAYGGIRYESGVSRQFQYEKTQSRIGGTPWEYPMRYWENSPIFFADKVHTPVLIMANDQDGAVPWTQGIEYFTALRRLGKECYLFNYNGEAHGLRQKQNMRDWTRRMSEYFAHHLKKEPAPKWMTDGVPYRDRDAEKLPFAQSYIDAYVKAPPPPPAAEKPAEKATEKPAEKPAEAKGEAAPATGGGDSGAAAPGVAKAKPAAAEAAPKLQPGQRAPAFAVADAKGAPHTLADYRGKPLLVWFYPKADTPGCTAEGCGLRDKFEEFTKAGVAVLGVSFDDAAANAAFAEKHSLPFPLLCDTDRAMAIAYGAADDATAVVARRIAVLIDGEGKVVSYWGKVDPHTFAATAVAALPR